MKKLKLILLLIVVCQFAICQQSNYTNLFEWMVKTFEENDAGFHYYIEQKGIDNYKKHTESFRQKIIQVRSEQEFLLSMNTWLNFFRKGHIGFTPNISLSNVNNDSIRATYKNEETVNYDIREFEQYISNKNKIHPIEGIWKNVNYTIGIRQSNESNRKYDAFIIQADSIFWVPKQKKAELILVNDSTFDVTYSMGNHLKQKSTSKLFGSNYNFLSMYGTWTKVSPETKYSSKDSLYLNFVTSTKPFLRNLNTKTIYLRIPSFEIKQKGIIDKILFQNDKLIRSTPNLIIDIRNGTGGNDYSASGLIPYYYTNPIRHPGLKYRATELNAKEYEEVYENKSMAYEMRKHLNGYFETTKGAFLINSYSPIKYPNRVAVICNKNNASADEGFLFMVKQSFKVKVFGRPTAGMFDFSNVNSVKSPDNKYVLYLTMSERKEFRDYRVDDIGIQPDIFIDESISDDKWVDFVRHTLESE